MCLLLSVLPKKSQPVAWRACIFAGRGESERILCRYMHWPVAIIPPILFHVLRLLSPRSLLLLPADTTHWEKLRLRCCGLNEISVKFTRCSVMFFPKLGNICQNLNTEIVDFTSVYYCYLQGLLCRGCLNQLLFSEKFISLCKGYVFFLFHLLMIQDYNEEMKYASFFFIYYRSFLF